MQRARASLSIFSIVFAAINLAINATADEAPDKSIDFKLLSSFYQVSDGNHANDINLRAKTDNQTGWVGIYRDHNGFQQERVGYENTQAFDHFHVTLSPELASGGYIGGSIETEWGDDTYLIAGWSRTNLKPFYNLNFDPGDALTLGIGSKAFARTELSLYHIWDDRLGTEQQVTHAVARYEISPDQHCAVDMAYKRGFSDTGKFVEGYSMMLSYDYDSYFVRIGRDQYVNFSHVMQNTFALGKNF
ncbi:MAG: hypothetical protein JWM78_3377 [Verrucomicrobiaceae bacterium]|nr:hypothetical protein [Verrucomicrobiaceae bacterium]